MSTRYYRIAKPVTSLRLIPLGGVHVGLHIWVNHGKAGDLTLRSEELKDFMLRFVDLDLENPPMRTHWGGTDAGTIVTTNDATLLVDELMMSEYGELFTVADILALANRGEKP